jgi:hypothetical protein
MLVLRRLAQLSDVVVLNFGLHHDASDHDSMAEYERTVRASWPPFLLRRAFTACTREGIVSSTLVVSPSFAHTQTGETDVGRDGQTREQTRQYAAG